MDSTAANLSAIRAFDTTLGVTQQSYTATLKVLLALDEIQGRLMDLLA